MNIVTVAKKVDWPKLGLSFNRSYLCELCGCSFSLKKDELAKVTKGWEGQYTQEEVVNPEAGISKLYSIQQLFAFLVCPSCGHSNKLGLKKERKVFLKKILF